MVDYELKAHVISTGLVDEYRKIQGALFRGPSVPPKYSGQLDFDTALYERNFLSENQPEEWLEAKRCSNNDYHRVTRLQSRIAYFLSRGSCLFLTLTFSDETLSKTSEKTRRVYVTRYLKSVCKYYVANVDYGAKNGREHYHALVVADKIDYTGWHQYGAINGKKIAGCSEPKKLARYISKLTNHAIKATNKRCVIIYSKHIFKDLADGFVSVKIPWEDLDKYF